MHPSYPLLVDQNGWGVGAGSSRNSRDPAALLRSIGADLTNTYIPYPTPADAASAFRNVEVHVGNHVPPPPLFAHEYPQLDGRIRRGSNSRNSSFRTKKSPVPRYQREHSGSPGKNSLNRSVHRLDVSPHPDIEVYELTPRKSIVHIPIKTDTHSPTPKPSPCTSSPRRSNIKDYGSPRRSSDEHFIAQCGKKIEEQNYLNPGSMGNLATSYGIHSPGPGSRYGSDRSICVSPPRYYCSNERLRQEPEPGLLACCDRKVNCCFCIPCCEPWCPTGHLNSVCTSLICFGIILFIVLSPLLHFLVPT